MRRRSTRNRIARILLTRYYPRPRTLVEYRAALYEAATVIYAVECPGSLAVAYEGLVYYDRSR